MYETKAFKYKTYSFPRPQFRYGQLNLPHFLPQKKEKKLAFKERHYSEHNGLCFGPKWLAWLNGLWESVLRVSAWDSKSQQMQWKWTPSSWRKERKIYWYGYDHVYMTICENGRWYVLLRSRQYVVYLSMLETIFIYLLFVDMIKNCFLVNNKL